MKSRRARHWGTANDIKGRVKPLCFGYALQVPAVTVNTAGQIMQVHDGGVASIIEAYANGAPAAFTPDHGNGRYTYDVNVANFDLTADVKGARVSSWDPVRVGHVMLLIAEDFADVPYDNVTDREAFFVTSFTGGVYVTERKSVREVMDYLAASAGIWYMPDANGILRFGQLTAPAGAPEMTLTAPMLVGEPRMLRSNDEGGGQPAWKVIVKGRRHWFTHDPTTVAQSLLDERKAELAEEWRRAVAEAPAVKDGYPDAIEIEIETALHELTDMETEAARLLEIYQHRQQFVEITVASRHVTALWVGDEARLIYPRYGLGAGADFIVMRKLVAGPKTSLELWRPLND